LLRRNALVKGWGLQRAAYARPGVFVNRTRYRRAFARRRRSGPWLASAIGSGVTCGGGRSARIAAAALGSDSLGRLIQVVDRRAQVKELFGRRFLAGIPIDIGTGADGLRIEAALLPASQGAK